MKRTSKTIRILRTNPTFDLVVAPSVTGYRLSKFLDRYREDISFSEEIEYLRTKWEPLLNSVKANNS